MQIKELFSRDTTRDIKEVIKVDDREPVLDEIEEYVPTGHITEKLEDTLDRYQGTINNPSEEINIWISGFFGSGKSSFAKVLGYLLADPTFGGTSVADRFFELNELPKIKALLNTIHEQAPTESVLLDLNTSPNVLEEGEPVELPIYRTILGELGYSRDVVLAELEFELEGDGELEAFEAKYSEIFGTSWENQKHVITAKNRASRILHELDSATFPAADSWSNAAKPPTITAKWLVKRVLELLGRRRPGKKRLVLIVDEVGQYVSRSTDRMRHLQGLAEECQKSEGRLWLVATSQEKLTDVVDSLEGKQTELAKAKDRFPITVDLLPSDIDEVTGKRILDKTAAGAAKVRELLAADRNKLITSVSPQSDRYPEFSDDDFVRLYPLVPYQLQVLIDAVSARRAQGGAPQTMGGSNRTLIRHAQQLISNPSVGLAGEVVGLLVTLDRSYSLLEDVIPTAWRNEVDQVAAKHGGDSLEAKIMRVIALCADVPGLNLNARNLAVVLHPSTSSDPIETQVNEALGHLVAEDRVRESDDGYQLQSPEQKDWEKTRRNIDMKPGDATRLRKRILKDTLGALTVTKGRTFKVELYAEAEKMSDGDVTLDVRAESDIDQLRKNSRADEGKNRIFWAYDVADDTWESLTELHRSIEMIDRHDHAGQNDAVRNLVTEERKRRDRARKAAEQLLERDLAQGTTVFDGNTTEAPTGTLRAAAERLVTELLDKIYPNLDLFAGSYKKAEVLQILQADTLDGIPETFGPEKLGLFKVVASGRELVTDSGPIHEVVTHINARKQYGEDQNGAQLERHFAAPPYGAPVEAVQATLAGAMRAGLIEVVSQAARITAATDHRLEQVFGNIPKFRAASFKPAQDTGPSIDVRGRVSEWLKTVTGEAHSLDVHELAEAARAALGSLQQPCTEARALLSGAGLAVPEVLKSMDELLSRVMSPDDELVVTTVDEHRVDLDAGRKRVTEIATLVDEQLGVLQAAADAAKMADDLAEVAAPGWGSDLAELLGRARYDEDLAKIKALTTKIEETVAAEIEAVRSEITSKVESAVTKLRSLYPTVADDVFDAETGSLTKLSDADDLVILRANTSAVSGIVQKIAEHFDALTTTKQVKHVRVSDVWAAPITNPGELDAALERIRERVLAELDDDTEVRFR